MAKEDNKFRVAVRKFDAFETAIKNRWAEFSAASGCTLQLEAVPMDLPALHHTLFTKQGLKKGDWDLAHISSDWMAAACATGAVINLDQFNTAPDFYDSWPVALLRSQTFGGKHFALPFHDGPECLIYRKDLFEDLAHQAAFLDTNGYPLQPPADWSQFHDIAQYFQQPSANRYGTAWAAFPDGHNAVYDFCIQTWTRGGDFINAEGDLDFMDPSIQEGLTYYRLLAGDPLALHPDSQKMDSVALGEAFTRGELAMMINWFGFAHYSQLSSHGGLSGKIGVAPIPHERNANAVAPNSYWVYGIGAGSTHHQIAFDFMQFATSAKCDVNSSLEGCVGCRKSTWKDETVNQLVPFFQRLESLHTGSRELPASEAWPAVANLIDDIMTQVIQTARPIKVIAQEANQKAAALHLHLPKD